MPLPFPTWSECLLCARRKNRPNLWRPIPLIDFIAPNSPGPYSVPLTFGGLARSYLLPVPPNYTGTTAVPLVIDLHGYTDTSERQSQCSGFAQKADEQGFLLAWPQGIDNSWNGYGCCGNAHATNVDDVGFIRQVVADIRSKGRVDAGRIYATESR